MRRIGKWLRYGTLGAALGLSLTACSVRQAVEIAVSGNPRAAAESIARAHVRSYAYNPERLVRDIRTARNDFQRLVDLLRGRAGRQWGRGNVLTPTAKRYVKYTQNYLSRAVVQFDRGRVTVETLDQKAPDRSLHNAIVTTLLTPDDPGAVDLYSDRTIRLSGRPYLYGLVHDERGRAVGDPARAGAFADWLISHRLKTRQTDTPKGRRTVRYVSFAMVSDYQNVEAQRYLPAVETYARRYNVSPSLVLAVMKTESAFDPFAVSSAPAYGLMQVVPATAGRDAYSKIHGYHHTPSKAYLFNPNHNIQLGTAYLGIIEHDYLAGIGNPVSREYCTIAAYNGGAGSVLDLFSRDRGAALDTINRLTAAQVYNRIRYHHPRAETRRYLVKVLAARRDFVQAGAATTAFNGT